MLDVDKVSKGYRGRRDTIYALRDVSFHIEAGEFLTITGPSGSGKTTLLLTIGGLIKPTAGRVAYHERDLFDLSERQLAEYRNTQIGFVLQTFNLIPYLSALENVMVPMIFSNSTVEDHRERAEALLDQVGLTERMDHLPRELSVGEQQRVAIARALANDPRVILADEPTGNLDPSLSLEILDTLRNLNEKDGRTVIMVTHSREAAAVGSRHLRLSDGRISEKDGLKRD
jgi:putative ABC transport system ATP-binding protein